MQIKYLTVNFISIHNNKEETETMSNNTLKFSLINYCNKTENFSIVLFNYCLF